MWRNAYKTIITVFMLCPSSWAEEASSSVDACMARENACVARGKSMMQVSSMYTAVLSQNKDIPEITASDLHHSVNSKDAKAHCHIDVHASAVPLTIVGFNTVQQACCAPEMANFIKRFIEKDGNEVCNIGALNGFSSQYDCPNENDFSKLTTELTQAQSGDCAWIRNSQASTCPVMKSSCANYPSPSTPSGPSPPSTPSTPASGSQPVGPPPSTPSTPASGSQPVGPPAPAPTSSAPCNVQPTTTTAPTTTTLVPGLCKTYNPKGNELDGVTDSCLSSVQFSPRPLSTEMYFYHDTDSTKIDWHGHSEKVGCLEFSLVSSGYIKVKYARASWLQTTAVCPLVVYTDGSRTSATAVTGTEIDKIGSSSPGTAYHTFQSQTMQAGQQFMICEGTDQSICGIRIEYMKVYRGASVK